MDIIPAKTIREFDQNKTNKFLVENWIDNNLNNRIADYFSYPYMDDKKISVSLWNEFDTFRLHDDLSQLVQVFVDVLTPYGYKVTSKGNQRNKNLSVEISWE